MNTLVSLIGKPGAGKTTIGDALSSKLPKSKHFSFGDLLKTMEPSYVAEGFTPEGRKKVYDFLIFEIQDVDYFIVDWNPYYPQGFYFLDTMRPFFTKAITVHLVCNDTEAEKRLAARKRRILLPHEGNVYKDRVDSFNTTVLPEIEKATENYSIIEVHTEDKDIDVLVNEITEIISR